MIFSSYVLKVSEKVLLNYGKMKASANLIREFRIHIPALVFLT